MRHEDWTARLWAEIEAASGRPFSWGEQDCCLFAARCVDAIAVDSAYVAELQAAYHDKTSALRYLVGQGGLHAALTSRFGEPRPWWNIRRGDLALMPTADGVGSVGVCVGPTVACVDEVSGIVHLPIDQAQAGWAIE